MTLTPTTAADCEEMRSFLYIEEERLKKAHLFRKNSEGIRIEATDDWGDEWMTLPEGKRFMYPYDHIDPRMYRIINGLPSRESYRSGWIEIRVFEGEVMVRHYKHDGRWKLADYQVENFRKVAADARDNYEFQLDVNKSLSKPVDLTAIQADVERYEEMVRTGWFIPRATWRSAGGAWTKD